MKHVYWENFIKKGHTELIMNLSNRDFYNLFKFVKNKKEKYFNTNTTMAGFEPARAKHNRLAADLLNHSDTLSPQYL